MFLEDRFVESVKSFFGVSVVWVFVVLVFACSAEGDGPVIGIFHRTGTDYKAVEGGMIRTQAKSLLYVIRVPVIWSWMSAVMNPVRG